MTPHNLIAACKLLANHGIRYQWLKAVTPQGQYAYGLTYHASSNGKDEHLAFARSLLAGMGLNIQYSQEEITIKL